jgi:TonB family protein
VTDLEEIQTAPPPAASGRGYGSLSELWFSARPVILIAALILFSLYANDAIIEYRMEEYNRSMEALSQSYNSGHALNMLARFELIKQRQNVAEEGDETALELKLQSLASRKLIERKAGEKSLQTKAIELVIRGMGVLLGKKRVLAEVPGGLAQELEVAYFYERSRKYDKAIGVYTRALEGTLAPEVAATLHLHRGFCASLLGDYAKAIEDFARAAALVPESEESRVALRLSEMTRGLQEEVRLARESKDQTPFQSGRRLFLLANYAEAAKSLRKVIEDARADEGQKLESRYLYGRAQEELGQDSDAVLTYRGLIQHDPEGQYAKKANRRLYVLGKFYSNDEDLAKSALKKIEQYQDFKFINSLKSLEVARAPRAPVAVNPDMAPAPEDRAVEGLGKLDAVKAEDVRAADSAKAKPAAPEAEKVAATLKNDVQAVRKIARKIMSDPMRKEAIFATLKDNQGELEFIYQKWLRKGAPFEGDLTIRILIEPSGAVRDAKIVLERSTVDNPPFGTEILQTVKKWRFREDPGASGDVPVSFPVRFVNKDG